MDAEAEMRALARKYILWTDPDTALNDLDRLIAQVMAGGTWQDAHSLLRRTGRERFLKVLRSPPPGVFSDKAWHFWHLRLLGRAPESPRPPPRQFPQLPGIPG
jgi:hypothetical protein